jgi:hypothetical protein
MRRRMLFWAAVVGAVLVLPRVAGAQTPTEDSVTGNATSTIPGPRGTTVFAFDAHSGPSGENPTGSAGFEIVGIGGLGGVVTCLNVTGNRATIGILNPVLLLGAFFFVEDNDGAGQDRVGFTTAATGNCPEPLTGSGTPITSGDITVTDALPFPTSKEQCTNGGWQTFGIFKNQGDCVSFVATGGKNPPGKKAG